MKNKRYTLAVRRLEDGDTASSVLAEFLGILDGLDLEVKAVFLDREFYDSKCLTLLQAHNYAYVMPIVRWGQTIKQELSEGWSRVIQHDMTAKLDGHSWTNPVVRLLYVVVSLLLQNVWRYLHWEYVATPRRGGRRLWKWSFKEFINMIQRAAWTALATRRAVPANRPPDDRFTR